MSSYLYLNPDIHFRPFDSLNEGHVLCEIPTRSTNEPARYAIPHDLVSLIKSFDGSRTTQDVIREYMCRHAGSHSAARLREFVDSYCLPRGFLVDSAREYRLPEPPRSRRGYMSLRVKLIPACCVSILSEPLTWLFRWPVFLGLLPVFLATHFIFYAAVLPRHHFDLNSITGRDFLILCGIGTAFGLLHELGHATALASFGWKRAEIGWGLYIVLPVLYTNLSDAWRLTRTQRAMVDLGGIYFHFISLVGLLALSAWSGWRIWVYCFYLIDLQIASSLNPFLRMDGYWLTADLFGIPDLRRQSLGMLKRFASDIFRAPRNAITQPTVGLTKSQYRIFVFYSLVSVAFFVWMTSIMFRQIYFRILPAYPHLLMQCIHVLATKPTDILSVIYALAEVLWKGLALVGTLLFVTRILRKVFRCIQPRLVGEKLRHSLGRLRSTPLHAKRSGHT